VLIHHTALYIEQLLRQDLHTIIYCKSYTEMEFFNISWKRKSRSRHD